MRINMAQDLTCQGNPLAGPDSHIMRCIDVDIFQNNVLSRWI